VFNGGAHNACRVASADHSCEDYIGQDDPDSEHDEEIDEEDINNDDDVQASAPRAPKSKAKAPRPCVASPSAARPDPSSKALGKRRQLNEEDHTRADEEDLATDNNGLQDTMARAANVIVSPGLGRLRLTASMTTARPPWTDREEIGRINPDCIVQTNPDVYQLQTRWPHGLTLLGKRSHTWFVSIPQTLLRTFLHVWGRKQCMEQAALKT
jgi:hypothetical protein